MKEKKLTKLKNWITDHAEPLGITVATISAVGLAAAWYKIGVESGKDIACDILGGAIECMEKEGYAKYFNPLDGSVVDYPTAAELWLKTREQ